MSTDSAPIVPPASEGVLVKPRDFQRFVNDKSYADGYRAGWDAAAEQAAAVAGATCVPPWVKQPKKGGEA